jgi:hypothetical protein
VVDIGLHLDLKCVGDNVLRAYSLYMAAMAELRCIRVTPEGEEKSALRISVHRLSSVRWGNERNTRIHSAAIAS